MICSLANAGMNAVYACFLTPQGKYLADFFVYEHVDGELLLDVDQELLTRFIASFDDVFKLRSKADVVLTDVSEQIFQ